MIERRLVGRQVTTLGTIPAPFRTATVGPPIITEGLVGHWDAGNPYSYPATGTTWTNLSGTTHATLQNSATFSTDRNGAIVFDGTNQYATVGNLGSGFSSFSVLLWLYPTSVLNYKNVIDFNYADISTQENMGPRLEMDTTGALYWVYSNSTNDTNFYVHSVYSSGFAANVWAHVGITYDGSGNTSKTYRNGVDTGLTRSSNGTPGPTGYYGSMTNLEIGRGWVLVPRYYQGRIASVMLYNRSLSATEVFQNFQSLRGRFGL